MNADVKEYLDAVLKRKPRLVGTNGVNMATLLQLQDDDVPLLCEMITVSVVALEQELENCTRDSEAVMLNTVLTTLSEMAKNRGVKGRFGGHVPNGWFRKRPVAVKAVLISEVIEKAKANWAGLSPWVAEAYEKGKLLLLPDGVEISTLEGTMKGGLADWMICGVKGEIYPCKPDIFQATYEPA